MKRLKVMTVVGTRPELIKLSRVISCLDANTDHILVHTGQNFDFELNEIFFRDLEIRKPDHYLNAAGNSAVETISKVMVATDSLLEATRPDAFLILGDTNSCFCVVAAKKRKIPIFHMEAGNRCFDQRVPEEVNRKVIDHMSDINLPYSDIARSYLIREGLPEERIIKTGSPMSEVLSYFRDKIEASQVLGRLELESRKYFVVSAHREENVDSDLKFKSLIHTLNRVAEVHGKKVIFSIHPRTRKRLEQNSVKLNPLIQEMKPLGFFDYVKLQQESQAVLSDSGTIMEESSILNFPAITMREAHERPEGMEEASIVMTGVQEDEVLRGIDVVSRQPRGENRLFRVPADYDIPNVSEKVLRIIMSYTEYVNRTVWKK